MAAPTTSIHDRLMTDVAAVVTALNLQGAKDTGNNTIVGDIGDHVYTQTNADLSNVYFPNALVLCEAESEQVDDAADGFEESAQIIPVTIWISDHDSNRDQKSRPTYQLWRYTIAQTLLGLPTGIAGVDFLPNTPECWDINVKYLRVFDNKQPMYQFVVSALVALCRVTTPRWRGGVPPT